MARRRLFCGCLIIVAICVTAGAGRSQQRSADPASQAIPLERVLVDRYCVGCQYERTKTAGLALNVQAVQNVGENPQVWENVLRILRSRMMPPIGRPRPDEATYDATVLRLEDLLDRAA